MPVDSHLTSPQVCLTTHITDVVNAVLYEDLRDIVLVGFSYGGFVVTGALEHIGDRVRHLVYLDAFVPEDGDTVEAVGGAGTGRWRRGRNSGGFLLGGGRGSDRPHALPALYAMTQVKAPLRDDLARDSGGDSAVLGGSLAPCGQFCLFQLICPMHKKFVR
jgi:pimeloyl-ACP methyl ester carboxylesterase